MDKKYSGGSVFRLTGVFWAYLAVLFFALIFTQALRSTASSVMFYFLLLLPVFLLLYTLIARASVKVYLEANESTAQKFTPVEYEFSLINESIFPFPFMDMVINVPEEDGVRCTEKMFAVSIMPSGKLVFKNRAMFKYRGNYEIGVACIYVYDFLRMFRVRVDINNFTNIIVLPRKLRLDETASTSVTDIPTDSARVVSGIDQSEIGNIREYRMGDPLKAIHWKLSSKGQELQVKEFNTNTGKHIYMFVDFARAPDDGDTPELTAAEVAAKGQKSKKRRQVKKVKLDMDAAVLPKQSDEPMPSDAFDEGVAGTSSNSETATLDHDALAAAESEKMQREFDYAHANRILDKYKRDMDEFVADGVTELAVATVLRELRNGNDCTLLWFDSREYSGISSFEMSTPEDFESLFKRFATTPLTSSDNSVMRLCPFVTESQNITVRVVTGAVDSLSISGYAAIPAMFGGAGTGSITEILVFNPDERFADPAARNEYIGLCRSRLAQNGVVLTAFRTGELK